jgi:hypothetical protein
MFTQATARRGIGAIPVAALLLSAVGAPLPAARAQAFEDFDIDHTITPTFKTEGLDSSADWLRSIRASSWVGWFCGDVDGFTLFPTEDDVQSGVLLRKQVYTEGGKNHYTTALAEAQARWDEKEVGKDTHFTLFARSFGSSNPVPDSCIGKKLRSARAWSRANSELTLTVSGVADGTNEVQSIKKSGEVTKGTFTITFDDGTGPKTTAAIDFDATATVVDTELEKLTTIGVGGVEVTGSAGPPWTVEFQGNLKSKDVSMMSVDSSLLENDGSDDGSYGVVEDTTGGTKEEKAGALGFTGKWVNRHGGTFFNPKTREQPLSDPVVARMLDVSDPSNPVVLNTWNMIDVKSTIRGNGETRMFHDGPTHVTIANKAADMEIRVAVSSGIVAPNDRGLIHVKVENGTVTQRTVSGRFASVPGIPGLGMPGTTWNATFNMDQINYTIPLLPGVPTEIEIAMGGGTQVTAHEGLISSGCNLLTDIGFDGPNLSVRPPGDTAYGFSAQSGIQSVMELLTTTADTELDFLVVPFFITGAPSMTVPTAVYVQIWEGNPLTGGFVLHGDLVTPRSMVVAEVGTPGDPANPDQPSEFYRVDAGNKKNKSREILEAHIDLTWVPQISGGTVLGIEVMFDTALGFADISLPQSPFADANTDGALGFSHATNTWSILRDPGSGRAVCFANDVYASDPEGCYADCDGTGNLDVFDFLCFFNGFNANDPIADCDIDGAWNVFDFLCFFNDFNEGC